MSFPSVLLLIAALVLVPTLLYGTLFWWLDRYEKEPLPLLLVAFFWGAIPAIIIALLLELAIGIPLDQVVMAEQAREVTQASVIAPLVEEAVKAVILAFLLLAFRREFDDVLDGVVYGAMVGLGFACIENMLYMVGAAYPDGVSGGPADVQGVVGLWILRSGLFGLNHSMFTAFTGAALGYTRSLKKGWQQGLVAGLGLGTAMLFHALHNTLTTSVSVLANGQSSNGLEIGACIGVLASDWGGVALIFVIAYLSSVREGQVIQATLWEEVALGRFTPDEYATLSSGRKRWNARRAALFTAGFRRWRQLGHFFDLATELAFRKHRMTDGNPTQQTQSARDILRLRGEIDTLKSVMTAAHSS